MALKLLLLFLAWNCARQGYPPGGPADTTPPRILQVIPAPDSTRVSRNTPLLFFFSEKVDHKSFAQAIFITPSPVPFDEEGDGLKFDWRGQAVEVRFPDSLRANRTYVVTVGTELRDLRSNRLKDSFSFAFSTGDSLDRGEMRGQVFADKPAGALILAYILAESQEPDPTTQYADYYTQLGETGEFVLTNLAPGKYRVFVLTDGDGDRLYARGDEMIGVPPRDVIIAPSSPRARPLPFRLVAEDTLPPALASVSAVSRQYVIWNFDEAVAPRDSAWAGRMHLISAKGDSARLFRASPHPLEPAQVHTITSDLQEITYRAWVDSIYDQAGELLDSLRSAGELKGTSRPDTTRPRLVGISIADSTQNVLLNAPLDLFFSELMRTDTAQTQVAVRDSAGLQVAGELRWPSPLQMRFQPQARWQSRARYSAQIRPELLQDWAGNLLNDTTGVITFWTINADTFASISGKITDSDSTAQGSVQVFARKIGGKDEYHVQLEQPGAYLFREVLPGQYCIGAFRDANRNGRYDFGSPSPFRPAERYMVWPDTIKVRSRWPNEENDFELP
ncbi:MAG: Ig-like domain-containing protein [bacterium]